MDNNNRDLNKSDNVINEKVEVGDLSPPRKKEDYLDDNAFDLSPPRKIKNNDFKSFSATGDLSPPRKKSKHNIN